MSSALDVRIKVPNFYNSWQMSQHRLHGTMCQYDGKVYLFMSEVGNGKYGFGLYDIVKSEKVKWVELTDPLIDISIPKLGYMTIIGTDGKKKEMRKVIFAHRPPIRGGGYKQGLSSSTINFTTINGVSTYFSWSAITPYLEMLFDNKYPSLAEGIEKGWDEFALSRDVALLKVLDEYLIFVKTLCVGSYKPGEKPVLYEQYGVVETFLEGLFTETK